METKFNFKSQICTTKEQSERLLALGIKKETADMTHHYLNSIDSYELKDIEFSRIMHLQELVNKKPVLGRSGDDLYAKDIPAWSLHRLWELLGKIKKYEGEDELLYPRISLEEDDVILKNPKSLWVRRNFCSPKGVYENIINCLEELIKEGHFNKEYLEEL